MAERGGGVGFQCVSISGYSEPPYRHSYTRARLNAPGSAPGVGNWSQRNAGALHCLLWSSVPQTTTNSAPSVPKSEPLWPEGLVKVILLLPSPTSSPTIYWPSQHVMSVIGLFWPQRIEKSTQADLDEK